MKLTDKRFWITIQYICVLFLTVCFTGLLVSDLFVWFIAIFFWLFIPAVIVACISFICSLRCNDKHKKILLILNVVNILLFSFLFFNPSNRCDADIMESHYIEYGGRMERIYYNPQIQISVVSGTKRSIFRQKNKTKRSKKRLHTTLIKPEQKVNEDLCSGFIVS